MDLETAVRYKLHMVICIMNNNGVYHGLPADTFHATAPSQLPPTALSVETRYDMLATSCGAKGYLVRTPTEIKQAMTEALSQKNVPCVLNILIQPNEKKQLAFNWMATEAKL
jgi:2-hydroxyacyl-CoA lyase 1